MTNAHVSMALLEIRKKNNRCISTSCYVWSVSCINLLDLLENIFIIKMCSTSYGDQHANHVLLFDFSVRKWLLQCWHSWVSNMRLFKCSWPHMYVLLYYWHGWVSISLYLMYIEWDVFNYSWQTSRE